MSAAPYTFNDRKIASKAGRLSGESRRRNAARRYWADATEEQRAAILAAMILEGRVLAAERREQIASSAVDAAVTEAGDAIAEPPARTGWPA